MTLESCKVSRESFATSAGAHERDEKLHRRHKRQQLRAGRNPTIAGIASGEFDATPEMNDALLELIGYSRDELAAGQVNWIDLTPIEYTPLDDLAHEEGLRFGASTPFEKELIAKDGTGVPVMVTTAVLKLCPFRWITFVQDLRERDRIESVDEADVDGERLRRDRRRQHSIEANLATS